MSSGNPDNRIMQRDSDKRLVTESHRFVDHRASTYPSYRPSYEHKRDRKNGLIGPTDQNTICGSNGYKGGFGLVLGRCEYLLGRLGNWLERDFRCTGDSLRGVWANTCYTLDNGRSSRVLRCDKYHTHHNGIAVYLHHRRACIQSRNTFQISLHRIGNPFGHLGAWHTWNKPVLEHLHVEGHVVPFDHGRTGSGTFFGNMACRIRSSSCSDHNRNESRSLFGEPIWKDVPQVPWT